MNRCLQLALLGKANVAPNPMVGAVLVADGRIIGEGYHQHYGQAHAEVNCLQSVREDDRHLIQSATLYVSLEPCSHFGKTPPCSDLIISNHIPRVVVGALDPFPEVNGCGIQKLKDAGVDVKTKVLNDECREVNRYFFHFQEKKRPYVILKWAQSADGYISGAGQVRTRISNAYTNRLVHQWRTEAMAIMVGRNTAIMDDPELTTRLWPGRDPIRVLVDPERKVPASAKIFLPQGKVVVCSYEPGTENEHISHLKLRRNEPVIGQVVEGLYQQGIHSVLVEGGAILLQSFIAAGAWDEARVITNEQMFAGDGLSAPSLENHRLEAIESIYSDNIRTYKRAGN